MRAMQFMSVFNCFSFSCFFFSPFEIAIEMKMCKFCGALRFKSVFGWGIVSKNHRNVLKLTEFELKVSKVYFYIIFLRFPHLQTDNRTITWKNSAVLLHFLLSSDFHFLFLGQQPVSLLLHFILIRLNSCLFLFLLTFFFSFLSSLLRFLLRNRNWYLRLRLFFDTFFSSSSSYSYFVSLLQTVLLISVSEFVNCRCCCCSLRLCHDKK